MKKIAAEFLSGQFGDKRLNNRCLSIINKVSLNPSLSFPEMGQSWAWLKGLYRFFANPKITWEKIMQGHIENTVQRCLKEEVVLAIQDTTYLDYSQHPQAKGLGLISQNEYGLGMLVHNVFAVSGSRQQPLGLLHQEIIVREETKDLKTKKKKESRKWFLGLKKSRLLLTGHKKVIQVCDREADIYFFIKAIIKAGQGFVIRWARNRKTLNGDITEEIKKAETRCYQTIKISRNGRRKSRKAKIEIKTCRVTIKAPKSIKSKTEILPVNLVIAEEINPPEGVEPLYWVLLTSEPIDTEKDCLTVIKYYQARWIIEELHKGLKTGCQLENRQLSTRQQLEKLLALFSIMTFQLLLLRFLARNQEIKNENILTDVQIQILKNKFPQEFKNDNQPSTNKFLFLIARLGGFIGRKSDGQPGWLVLMRGIYDLFLIEQGVLLAAQLVGKG